MVTRRQAGSKCAVWAVLVILAFTLFQALTYRDVVPSNDTYQYARQTLRILGYSQPVAVHDSVVMFCQDISQSPKLEHLLQRSAAEASNGSTSGSSPVSGYTACLDAYHNGLTPSSPRYIAIFTSRPGYPLAAAPVVDVFGLRLGLWLTAMFFVLLGSVLVLMLLRAAGCGTVVAVAGQALFLILPTGYWGTRMLTDGPSLTAALAALLGAWWLTRRRIRLGGALFCAGSTVGFLVRYSSETMVALALTAAALVCLARLAHTRHRGTYWLAGLAALASIGSLAGSTLLGWPGFPDSLQDTFTNHFEFPDVAHPLGELEHADFSMWPQFAESVSTLPLVLLPVAMVAIAVLLWRRDRVYAALVTSVAVTGVVAVVAHPIAGQAERLITPAWLLVVLGLPVLLTRWAAAGGPEAPADLEAPAHPDPGPGGDSNGDSNGRPEDRRTVTTAQT